MALMRLNSVAGWALLLLTSGLPHARAQNFSAANIQRVGTLVSNKNVPVGSCFLVDTRGYVATCLSNVSQVNEEVSVIFPGNRRLRVSGVLAASRAKDIAILKLGDLKQHADLLRESLDLRVDADPQIDEELAPWAGPLPAINPLGMPVVTRRLRGDEYWLGSTTPIAAGFGNDPELRWLWLDGWRPRSVCGGPLFNRLGHVVAMAAPGPNANGPIFSAIHISAVVEMITVDEPPTKSVHVLKNWTDPSAIPLPSINTDLDQDAVTWPSLGGVLDRGLPLADRYAALHQRADQAAEQAVLIGRKEALLEGEQLQQLAKLDIIAGQIKAIVPEEEYQEKRKQRVRKTRVRNGQTETYYEDEYVTETEYRFSSRQRAILSPLRQQQTQLQTDIQIRDARGQLMKAFYMPHFTRLRQELESSYFFMADPLGIYAQDEQQALEMELGRIIEAGGAPGLVYVARGMLRCHLQDSAGAEADLGAVDAADAKLQPLIQGVRARLLQMSGQSNKAEALVRTLRPQAKLSPLLSAILARQEIDQGKTSSALRYLRTALEQQPNQTDLHQALAWYMAKAASSPKQAVDAAEMAVQLTGGRDWMSLAALASAHASAKQPEQAAQSIAVAISAAPHPVKPRCQQYQQQLQTERSIKL